MPVRLPPVLVVIAVAAIFLAGLFVHGIAGGVLLVICDAILVGLSYTSPDRPSQRGLGARLVIVVLIALLAIAKFTGNV